MSAATKAFSGFVDFAVFATLAIIAIAIFTAGGGAGYAVKAGLDTIGPVKED